MLGEGMWQGVALLQSLGRPCPDSWGFANELEQVIQLIVIA